MEKLLEKHFASQQQAYVNYDEGEMFVHDTTDDLTNPRVPAMTERHLVF